MKDMSSIKYGIPENKLLFYSLSNKFHIEMIDILTNPENFIGFYNVYEQYQPEIFQKINEKDIDCTTFLILFISTSRRNSFLYRNILEKINDIDYLIFCAVFLFNTDNFNLISKDFLTIMAKFFIIKGDIGLLNFREFKNYFLNKFKNEKRLGEFFYSFERILNEPLFKENYNTIIKILLNNIKKI